VRCHCGALAEGCALLGYCTGPLASARDREIAEADRAFLRGLFPDHRSASEIVEHAEVVRRELAAVDVAETRRRIAEAARDDARLTRWCDGCGVDVFPVYPTERACVRCGESFEIRQERAA
jgi:hypothetical protein